HLQGETLSPLVEQPDGGIVGRGQAQNAVENTAENGGKVERAQNMLGCIEQGLQLPCLILRYGEQSRVVDAERHPIGNAVEQRLIVRAVNGASELTRERDRTQKWATRGEGRR